MNLKHYVFTLDNIKNLQSKMQTKSHPEPLTDALVSH